MNGLVTASAGLLIVGYSCSGDCSWLTEAYNTMQHRHMDTDRQTDIHTHTCAHTHTRHTTHTHTHTPHIQKHTHTYTHTHTHTLTNTWHKCACTQLQLLSCFLFLFPQSPLSQSPLPFSHPLLQKNKPTDKQKTTTASKQTNFSLSSCACITSLLLSSSIP